MAAIVLISNVELWAQGARGPALVAVAPVVEQEAASSETFIGTVMAKRRSIVGCAVDGRVLHFFAEEGDLVKMQKPEEQDETMADLIGQPVAQLRTKTLEIQIAAALAERELRAQELKQLEASLPQQLEQAKARKLASEAKSKFAQSDLKRVQGLFRQARAVSQADLDAAVSTGTSTQQDFLEASSRVVELEQTSDLKIAQAQAKLLVQEEEVHRLTDLKAKYTIRAPFKGHVVTKHVEVGQWVQQGDPIVEIIELDPVEVELALPASYIHRLQGALAAKLTANEVLQVEVQIDALPDQLFSGKVTKIVPDADRRSRSFPVKVEVPNSHDAGHPLKPGMLARVSLSVGSQGKVLMVPKDALVLGGRSRMVYVMAKTADGKGATAKPVNVTIGAAFGSMVEVRGDLKKGDQVVIAGNERLRPGQAIRTAEDPTSSDPNKVKKQ